MKSGLWAGAIAGIVAGIVGIIVVTILVATGLSEPVAGSIARWYTSQIGFNLVWGAIFGALYVKFQNQIPGKGILKGLVFGLLIWVIHSIYPATFYTVVASPPWVSFAINWVSGGFIVRALAYGSVLGALYKKE